MKNASYDTDLTDQQWHSLDPLIPQPKKIGRPRTCLRRVLNVIFYVVKTSCH